MRLCKSERGDAWRKKSASMNPFMFNPETGIYINNNQ